MVILGIETSCDETAAAVVTNDNKRIQVLSKVISSSALLHAKYGGVIPDQTAREQQKLIIPTINEALSQAGINVTPQGCDIDAIAVTQGPGLIGALLVGVETAKTLSLIWNKPLTPVNHLMAHFYANWVDTGSPPTFPCIGLLISGGHTDIILMREHGVYDYLGGTRDDAAGECFDKCARILNLPYPGGPNLAKLAEGGDPNKFELPKPMWSSNDLDLSFSGLKTAFSRVVDEQFKLEKGHFDEENQRWVQIPLEQQLPESKLQDVKNLCASLEKTIIDILIKKVVTATQDYQIEDIILAGGVASNQKLRESASHSLKGKVFIPAPALCTDNAVTTAICALFNYSPVDPLTLQANPNLSLK